MGQTISGGCSFKYRVKVLLVGLGNSGKSTILFKLKTSELVETVPTYNFNRASLDYRNIRYKVWDLAGRDGVRDLWKFHVPNVSGIIFVVDSTDGDRMSLAAEELATLLAIDELRSVVVLVLANKQDLPDAMSPTDIVENLHLPRIVRTHQKWHLQPTETIHGNGLHDGLDWMTNTLLKYHLKSKCPCRLPCGCL